MEESFHKLRLRKRAVAVAINLLKDLVAELLRQVHPKPHQRIPELELVDRTIAVRIDQGKDRTGALRLGQVVA